MRDVQGDPGGSPVPPSRLLTLDRRERVNMVPGVAMQPLAEEAEEAAAAREARCTPWA